MPKITKEVRIVINQLSNKLGKSYVLERVPKVIEATEVDIDKRRELKVADDGYLKKNQLVLKPINHYSRIEKAYKKNGTTGVNEYIQWLSKNNEKLNKILSVEPENIKPTYIEEFKETVKQKVSEQIESIKKYL